MHWVHTSDTPLSSLKYPDSHALTRLSAAEEHVYVAEEAAPDTTVHAVHCPASYVWNPVAQDAAVQSPTLLPEQAEHEPVCTEATALKELHAEQISTAPLLSFQ